MHKDLGPQLWELVDSERRENEAAVAGSAGDGHTSISSTSNDALHTGGLEEAIAAYMATREPEPYHAVPVLQLPL